MKVNRTTCWATFALSLLMAVTPINELAAQEVSGVGRPSIRTALQAVVADVELGPGGVIQGQVVDSVGHPLANQRLVIQQGNREAVFGQSDQFGRFRMSGVGAGVCQVTCGEYAVACRCWTKNTAPPAATKDLLMTIGDATHRGQRPIADLLTGPVLIGLIIAAAVAIPIAVHNAQDDAS